MRNLVIIPTYNEAENISAVIEHVLSLPTSFDILVVDDGSPDGTAAIVKGLQTKNVHLLERSGKSGLGSAYIAGFRWALDRDYDFIFEMDADFSHNPDDLVRLFHRAVGKDGCDTKLPRCEMSSSSGGARSVGLDDSGADVVIGSRYVSGVNVVNWPLGRLLMSWFASLFVRIVTRMPVRDSTAGFVCYSRRVLQSIDLDSIRMRGYGFQIEMKYTAWRLGFSLSEVSIIFIDRTLGVSKMSGGIFSEAFWGVLSLPFRRIKAR